MGRFSYGAKITADFDDRVMAHVQTVIAAKLRRGESFLFTWIDDDSTGDGRTTIWVHPRADLGFKYFGKRPPSINRAWVEQMMLAANSVTGLQVMPEPPDGNGNGRVDHLNARTEE